MILPKIKLVTEMQPDSDTAPEVIVSAEFPDGHQQCDLHFSLSDISVAIEVMQFLASVLADVKEINGAKAGACCDDKGYLGTTFLDGAGCAERTLPESMIDPHTGIRYPARRDQRASVERAFSPRVFRPVQRREEGWVEAPEHGAWGGGLPDGVAPVGNDQPFKTMDDVQAALKSVLDTVSTEVGGSSEQPPAAEAAPAT